MFGQSLVFTLIFTFVNFAEKQRYNDSETQCQRNHNREDNQ